jgi:hypothetical protein
MEWKVRLRSLHDHKGKSIPGVEDPVHLEMKSPGVRVEQTMFFQV